MKRETTGIGAGTPIRKHAQLIDPPKQRFGAGPFPPLAEKDHTNTIPSKG
ncbi:MAG TPA: hypothetical protein PLX02_03460 [Syntrophorhabdaceae bacterium]|nr:hypothetical protein [Syntrophorhabdaceae bacterium]HQM80657.1 hypothetical protein [Syntrophorhabdaceae bacterium]